MMGLCQPKNVRRGISVVGKEYARMAERGSETTVRTDMAQKASTYVGLGLRGGKLKWRHNHLLFNGVV